MVFVYFGDHNAEFGMEEIMAMTAGAVVERVACRPNGEDTYLTFMGKRLQPEEVLNSLGDELEDDSVLRVVCRELAPPTSTAADGLIAECRQLMKEYSKNHMAYALSALNETFFDPDFLKKQIEAEPKLKEDSEACQVLCDYFLFSSFFDEENEKASAWLSAHHLFVTAAHRLLTSHRSAMPRSSSFGRHNAVAAAARAAQAQAQQQQAVGGGAPLISPEMFHAAMMQAFGNAGSFNVGAPGGGVVGPASAPNPPSQPVPEAQPQQNATATDANRYAAQLTQLHEFGFADDAQNIMALESADGNVETALEILVALREDM